MSRRRVFGIALRQWLTLKRSLPRLFDVFYWPILEVALWGLVTQYLLTQAGATFAPSLLIGGMILWTQGDMVYAVGGGKTADELLNIASSLA